MSEASGRLFVKGNEAICLGAIAAGCRHYYGYPITPQNDIPEYLSGALPEMGGVFLQAESEVATINFMLGTSASGKRVMTSSSGPGISLMQEGLSYMAGSELPCVVVNISRSGPGLGGIAPSQGDYLQAVKCGGHGGYKMPVLAPHSVEEMYSLTTLAFDLADRLERRMSADRAFGRELAAARAAAEMAWNDAGLNGTGGVEPVACSYSLA